MLAFNLILCRLQWYNINNFSDTLPEMKKKYQNEVFYGKTRKLIENINEIAESYYRRGIILTVRQVYYQCVTRNLIANSKREYDKISDIVARGRLAGLIDWNFIEDRTRTLRENDHWDNPQEILRTCADQYRIDTRATQPYYIECWIEKDSLVAILESATRRLDVPCYSSRGFSSITALHEAADRLKHSGRENIILYAGDHDPSGLKISEVIEERLKLFDANFILKRIGITLSQIRELNLPPYPAKDKDGNIKEYIAKTGLKDAWELDALPPEFLMSLYESEVNTLTDFEKLHEMQNREKRDKSTLFELAEAC